MFVKKNNENINTQTLYLLDSSTLSRCVQKFALEKLFSKVRVFKSLDECIASLSKNLSFESTGVLSINLESNYIDGFSELKKIKEKIPDVKVVIHTSRKSEQLLLASLSSGAVSYILKGNDEIDYKKIFSNVLNYGFDIDFKTFDKIISNISNNEEIKPKKQKMKLTKREIEVLTLIKDGNTNIKIADYLGVSINTIKTQIKTILSKLKAKDRTQAVAMAIKLNIIKP